MNPDPRDVVEARALAELVLMETKQDNDAQPDPVLVAEALGVTMLDVPRRRLANARGLTSWVDGGYVIEVDETLAERDRQAVAAHELGHVCCRLWRIVPIDWERFAWIFSGALLVRSDTAADLWRRGLGIEGVLAAYPHVPPTATALAIGEHGIADVAVTQWRQIRYTRSRRDVSLDAVRLGLAAARSGRAARPGVARACRLSDMPGRAAVVLAS